MSDWNCPECGGRRTYSFTFDHDRMTCKIGKKEDATRMCDYDRLNEGSSTFERQATWAEIALADTVRGFTLRRAASFTLPGDPAPEGKSVMTVVTRIATGFTHRVVGGIDPDTIEPTEETE